MKKQKSSFFIPLMTFCGFHPHQPYLLRIHKHIWKVDCTAKINHNNKKNEFTWNCWFYICFPFCKWYYIVERLCFPENRLDHHELRTFNKNRVKKAWREKLVQNSHWTECIKCIHIFAYDGSLDGWHGRHSGFVIEHPIFKLNFQFDEKPKEDIALHKHTNTWYMNMY